MAITAQTKETVTRILNSHIESCNDYIKSSETYLHREAGKVNPQVDPDYYAAREWQLSDAKEKLHEYKSALKDIELNS